MSRIGDCFAKAAKNNHKLLIPYLMGGDPGVAETLSIMHAMVEAGADIIELGMPFSDPMADGPVIQAASERVLQAGIRLPDVLEIVRQFRESDSTTPLVLMGYANPLEIMGYEAFASAAAKAGVDGVITVDMPPEESGALSEAFANHALDPIFLISPTTPDSRVQAVCEQGSGFIYYVSLKGVTGSSRLDTDEVAGKVSHIKQLSAMPVGVGFGISGPESAAAVAAVADAVVVGSVIVKEIDAHAGDIDRILSGVSGLIGSMRRAIDEKVQSGHSKQV